MKRRFQVAHPDLNRGTRTFPCGQCFECLHQKATGWVLRLEAEALQADSCAFLTLTYDDIFVPRTETNQLTLEPKDLTKWIKRLRYEIGKTPKPIKYYAVGEYGENTYRPHYHGIFFNLPVDYTKYHKDSDGNTHTLFDQSWYMGKTHIGTGTSKSFQYVANYLQKKDVHKWNENDLRVPEFSRNSLGLGLSMVMNDDLSLTQMGLHLKKLTKGYVTKNGYKKPLPRYYRDKIFSRAELKKINWAQKKAREDSGRNRYSGNATKEAEATNQRYRNHLNKQKENERYKI